MFNKKNDPLVESVKAVMKENEFRRQAEAALNEELGISSKKALPHEYHTQYDALLEAKVVDAEKKAVDREKLMRPIRALTIKLPKMKKNDKEDDFYKERVKREIPEETQMSPKQKKLAMLGNTAGKGGNPNKIDEPDLNAARKGNAHKVGLEEKAVSQQQQKFFGLVSAIKKGKAEGSPEAEKVAKEMSAKEVRKFAKTKHEGLPKRVDEAEGDVDPSTMTPISKGLQGRIVKDPPAPAPAPKKMEEGVAMDRASAAGKMAYGTTKQPRTRIGAAQKEPNETTVGVMKSFLRRQEKKKDKPVAESVIDEIRRNLEENLMTIHESGDDELFENYVNSLTEEELDILGLSEDWRANAFGDITSGGSLSNSGYRAPPRVAAQARGTDRPQQQARPVPSPTSAARSPVAAEQPQSASRPASTSSSARPTPAPAGQPQQLSGPQSASRPASTSSSARPAPAPAGQPQQLSGPQSASRPASTSSSARPAPAPAASRAVPDPMTVRDPGTGEITGERDPGTGELKSKYEPPNPPPDKNISNKFGTPNIKVNRDTGTGQHQGEVDPGTGELVSGTREPLSGTKQEKPSAPRFTPAGVEQLGSAGAGQNKFKSSEKPDTGPVELGLRESVKPNDNRSLQIKESLESFLRNRFLKG